MDKGIERAIVAGKRNKATVELVLNWCAHATITRTGGIGLIEAQTGLPIGHLGMGRPYASLAMPSEGGWTGILSLSNRGYDAR